MSDVHEALPYGEFLNEEHHAVRQMVRDFAEKKLPQKLRKWIAMLDFPKRLLKP